MGLHGTREEAVDDVLRGHVLVDLYRVVQQGLCIGSPSYSIKKVEAHYMGPRDETVTDGQDSIVKFEEYLDTGDERLLEEIEAYNEQDWRSTRRLHVWLLDRRCEAIDRFGVEISWLDRDANSEPDPETPGDQARLRERLLMASPTILPSGTTLGRAAGCWPTWLTITAVRRNRAIGNTSLGRR
jgi:hypothetical protein